MKRIIVIFMMLSLGFLSACSDYSFMITGTWILQSGSWSTTVTIDSSNHNEFLTLGTYGFCRRDVRLKSDDSTVYNLTGTWSATDTTIVFTLSEAPYSGSTVTYNYSISGDYLTITNPSLPSDTLTYKKQW